MKPASLSAKKKRLIPDLNKCLERVRLHWACFFWLVHFGFFGFKIMQWPADIWGLVLECLDDAETIVYAAFGGYPVGVQALLCLKPPRISLNLWRQLNEVSFMSVMSTTLDPWRPYQLTRVEMMPYSSFPIEAIWVSDESSLAIRHYDDEDDFPPDNPTLFSTLQLSVPFKGRFIRQPYHVSQWQYLERDRQFLCVSGPKKDTRLVFRGPRLFASGNWYTVSDQPHTMLGHYDPDSELMVVMDAVHETFVDTGSGIVHEIKSSGNYFAVMTYTEVYLFNRQGQSIFKHIHNSAYSSVEIDSVNHHLWLKIDSQWQVWSFSGDLIATIPFGTHRDMFFDPANHILFGVDEISSLKPDPNENPDFSSKYEISIYQQSEPQSVSV